MTFRNAGCLFPFLAFLCFPAFLGMGALTESLPWRWRPWGYAATGLIALLGLVFAFFGRRVIVLNADQGEVVIGLRLFVTIPRQRIPLGRFDRVELWRGRSRAGSRRYPEASINLKGEQSLQLKWGLIGSPADVDEFARTAANVAEFLHLPLTEAGMAGSERAVQDKGAAPVQTRIIRTVVEGGVRFEIPPRGPMSTHRTLFRLLILGTALPAVVTAVGVYTQSQRFDEWESLAYAAGGPLPLAVIAALAAKVRFIARRQRERIVVESAGLRVEWDGMLFGPTRIFLPAHELRDLEIVDVGYVIRGGFAVFPAPMVRATTTRSAVRFAGGLHREELEWLLRSIRESTAAPLPD